MNRKKKPLITVIFGTRPEAIKLSTLIKKLKNCNFTRTRVVITGQHQEMVNQVMKVFDIREDLNLRLMKDGQTLTHITNASLKGLELEFISNRPDMVIVQGDTTTAFSAALAAFYKKIPVAHVEAGLRTNNLFNPYPEEANRRLISQIATLHFAPTKLAADNLRSNGINIENIFTTGNTVIDALKENSLELSPLKIKGLDWDKKQVILTTIHRRENWGDNLNDILSGIKQITEDKNNFCFLIPMHPNPKVRNPIKKLLGSNKKVFLIEPLDYISNISALKFCKLVLTDSGGIQEEAPTFGKPVLVLRNNSERIEAINIGCAKLVGTSGKRIYKEINELLHKPEKYFLMSQKQNPFGDGKACERILKVCLERIM